MYFSRLTIMIFTCFSHFFLWSFRVRVRVRFEVRFRSILFICTTIIKN